MPQALPDVHVAVMINVTWYKAWHSEQTWKKSTLLSTLASVSVSAPMSMLSAYDLGFADKRTTVTLCSDTPASVASQT